MVQWLELCALPAKGLGSIHGGEPKILHRMAKRKENTSDWCGCVEVGGGCLRPFEGQIDTVYYNTKMSASYNQENHFFESAEA